MKVFIVFLLLIQSSLIFASGQNYTGEKNHEIPQKVSHKIKTSISHKLIENVLKTVEILKEQSEMAYQNKKSKIPHNQSI